MFNINVLGKIIAEQKQRTAEALKVISSITNSSVYDEYVSGKVKQPAKVEQVAKAVVEKPAMVEKVETVKIQAKVPEPKPQESQPEKQVDETTQKQTGKDYPMHIVVDDGEHVFTWKDVVFSIPADKATKEFVAEIKGCTFEAFKALKNVVMAKPVAKPTEPQVAVGPAPVMMPLSDGSYLFHWGEHDIFKRKEDVDLEYIQKVMASSYELFAINAKAEGLKEASVNAQSETIEPEVQVGEATVPEDDLQSALKEATASMSQEQPTAMSEALKKAASEDRKYEEGKTFKYQSVRRKR